MVPLKSPVPTKGIGPDGEVHYFYHVDLSKLTSEQLDRAVKFVANKFGVREDEVRADLEGEHGMPILADDVSVSADARLFL